MLGHFSWQCSKDHVVPGTSPGVRQARQQGSCLLYISLVPLLSSFLISVGHHSTVDYCQSQISWGWGGSSEDWNACFSCGRPGFSPRHRVGHSSTRHYIRNEWLKNNKNESDFYSIFQFLCPGPVTFIVGPHLTMLRSYSWLGAKGSICAVLNLDFHRQKRCTRLFVRNVRLSPL